MLTQDISILLYAACVTLQLSRRLIVDAVRHFLAAAPTLKHMYPLTLACDLGLCPELLHCFLQEL